MASINISEELFVDLLHYFFNEETYDERLAENIRKQLDEKIEKLVSRELFTRYKRSPIGAVREEYRQKYLNHRGVFPSFRSSVEIPDECL